jgi:hypothetical protein
MNEKEPPSEIPNVHAAIAEVNANLAEVILEMTKVKSSIVKLELSNQPQHPQVSIPETESRSDTSLVSQPVQGHQSDETSDEPINESVVSIEEFFPDSEQQSNTNHLNCNLKTSQHSLMHQ